MKHLLIIAAFMLTACADHTHYRTVEVPGPTVEVPAPAPELSDVEKLVAQENEFRELQGQLPLAQGLTCSVSSFTSMPSLLPASLPAGAKSFVLKKEFNQPQASVNDGLNILPLALRTQYINNFMVRCSGYLVVTEPGNYSFELTSDDGSKLTIAGSIIVSHDGLHSTSTKVGSKVLNRGVHSFRLDYMQAGGEQSLILKSFGELVPATNFYR